MGFEDLDQFFDDSISLPIGGTIYRIPGPDAQLGLWCQRLCAAGYAANTGQEMPSMPELEFDDDSADALYKRLCGPAWDAMLGDGVSWPKMQVVGATVLLWVGLGKEAAERFWAAGGDPNASGPPQAQRRRAASKRTAAVATTAPRDSTSGTRSRKAKRAA